MTFLSKSSYCNKCNAPSLKIVELTVAMKAFGLNRVSELKCFRCGHIHNADTPSKDKVIEKDMPKNIYDEMLRRHKKFKEYFDGKIPYSEEWDLKEE